MLLTRLTPSGVETLTLPSELWVTVMPITWDRLFSAVSRWSSQRGGGIARGGGGLDLLIELIDLLDQRIGRGDRTDHLAVDLALQRGDRAGNIVDVGGQALQRVDDPV